MGMANCEDVFKDLYEIHKLESITNEENQRKNLPFGK